MEEMVEIEEMHDVLQILLVLVIKQQHLEVDDEMLTEVCID